MGCVCSRGSAVEDSREGITKKISSSELRVSSRAKDGVCGKNQLDGSDLRVSLIDKKADDGDLKNLCVEKKKGEKPEVVILNESGLGMVPPKATEGEQVAAGWPAWLSAVAGEAIKGWIPRSANTFEKLDKIGQGTYSSVYKARDVTHQKLVALKKVRFDNLDPESVKFMAREVLVLRRLDHPNIIKLEGLITSQTSRSLYLVFEYMEHDLTGLASRPGVKFSEPQIKCYMLQLLHGLEYCHSHNVLHRDIKGSNLLIDSDGILKIADFGLASYFDPDHSVPLTSRVVTLWYRPPELLLGASNYGVAVDLWSTGCILGELYTGKPILPGKTEVEQLHKIFKLCGSPSEDYWAKFRSPHSALFKPPHPYRCCVNEMFKEFPAPAVKLIESLLSLDPAHRGTAATALKSEFFTAEPCACDPSNLPKYPPSKEIDSKLRDELARRQGAVGGKEQKFGLGIRQEKETRVHPDPKTNVELHAYSQKGRGEFNSLSRSEIFDQRDEAVSGLLVFPSKQSENAKGMKKTLPEHLYKRPSYSGPLVHGPGWKKSGKELDERPVVSNGANLSKLSSLVANRGLLSQGQQVRQGSSRYERSSELVNGSRSKRVASKQQTQRIPGFYQVEDGRSHSKESTSMEACGSRESKIHVSGPLLVSSNNVEQMLKEHDRKIQEFSRRARLDKRRCEKLHPGR